MSVHSIVDPSNRVSSERTDAFTTQTYAVSPQTNRCHEAFDNLKLGVYGGR